MKQQPSKSDLEVTGEIQSGQLVFDRERLLRDRVAGDRAYEILNSLAAVVRQLDDATGTFRLIVSATANGRLHNSSLSFDLSGSNGNAADPRIGQTISFS